MSWGGFKKGNALLCLNKNCSLPLDAYHFVELKPNHIRTQTFRTVRRAIYVQMHSKKKYFEIKTLPKPNVPEMSDE